MEAPLVQIQIQQGIGYCGNVKIRGPSSVTATVCSQCAAREPSVVTTVQSSPRIFVFVVPNVSIGSIARTDPPPEWAP